MYTQRAVAVVIRCDSATTTRKCLPSRPPPLSKHQRYQLAGEYRLVMCLLEPWLYLLDMSLFGQR